MIQEMQIRPLAGASGPSCRRRAARLRSSDRAWQPIRRPSGVKGPVRATREDRSRAGSTRTTCHAAGSSGGRSGRDARTATRSARTRKVPGRQASVLESSSDDDFQPAGDAAEVGLVRLLRHSAGTQNTGDVGILHVSRNADPAVDPELRAAIRDEAGVAGVDALPPPAAAPDLPLLV